MAENKVKAAAPAKAATPAAPAQDETLEAKIARLEQELATKDQIIEGQATQLQTAELGASEERPVVTHEGKNYRVLATEFSYQGVKYKGAELKEKADVVAALVKAESGVLELIVKKEEAAEAAE